MKDSTLKKHLNRWKTPPPDPQARDRALDRSLIAFRQAQRVENAPGSPVGQIAFWRWAVAGCVLVLTLSVLLRNLPNKVPPKDLLATAKQTLHQMEKLFPGQINAVIERGTEVAIDLTPAPQAPSDQRVVVEFSHGREVLRVLSYSGREICVNLGGQPVCFDALVTAEGVVILSGENFLWRPDHPDGPGGFTIRAQALPSA